MEITDSKEVAKASVKLAISSREEEENLIKSLSKNNISAAAVDIGGNLINSIPKIMERALVSAKRCNVIKDFHSQEGAIIGATKEAIDQVSKKAIGFNVGGKIGIARYKEHISVCLFLNIGVLHLNDIVIGLGHRSISE